MSNQNNQQFSPSYEASDGQGEQGEQDSKKYSNIAPKVRLAFIKRVLSRQCTIKEAAKEFEIKFSTAKAILQTFKREGRIGKKRTRLRKGKNSSINLDDINVVVTYPPNIIENHEQLSKPIKKSNQKIEELQDIIKKIEQELGGIAEVQQQKEIPIESDPNQQINKTETDYQMFLMQQQLASYQMQNQMLQQYIQCNNPLLLEFQRELQNQRQINKQLFEYITKQQNIQQVVHQQHEIPFQTIQPLASLKASLKDFGSVKEEDDNNVYITPLQSLTNLEKFAQMQSGQQLPSFEFKGTLRDFL